MNVSIFLLHLNKTVKKTFWDAVASKRAGRCGAEASRWDGGMGRVDMGGWEALDDVEGMQEAVEGHNGGLDGEAGRWMV